MTAIADVSYAPGTLTAVAGDRCWVLVDAKPDSPAVGWLWQQLGQCARPEAILAGLLGEGFAGATEFALLYQEHSDAHRLFCRGAVAATVQGREPARGGGAGGPAEARRIDGSGLLTWRELAVPGTVRRILLGVPPADGALRLPATAGVLLASCVIIDLTDAVVRESVPHDPAPAVIRTVSDPGQAESARFPATVAMTAPPSIAEGTGSLSAIRPPPAPADGQPPAVAEEYDFLWGATQARTVADAAIREPDAGGARPPAFPASGAFNGTSAGTGMAMSAPPSLPPVVSSPLPTTAGLPPPGGLIDAMPWGPDPAAPDETGEAGFTVKRGNLAGPTNWAAPPPDKIGPAVPALICPAGHVNPPSEARCRRCGATLPPDPVVVPRPVLGTLRLSVGDTISLDRDVVMGRNPKPDFPGADGEERPHVVRLPTEDSDISRTHLRVTLDGWHVLVTDLNSTNGTLVTLPGREPEQLRPGQPVPIKPGTVVTLADGIDFRYEAPE
ncbi:MAG TPA: FHA domain-containing protein [Streptosporangiaceae bacterium]